MSMNARRLAGDAMAAFASQGLALALSAVTALVVPKVLGVEQYGLWQLFLFYAGYVGLFHFGLNDGMYLLVGGTPRGDADASSVSSQFKLGMAVQTLIAAFIALAAVFGAGDADRAFVLAATAVFLVVNNASLYWGLLFQAVGETRRYSAFVAVGKTAFLVPLVVLVAMRTTDFRAYVVAYLAAQLVGLAYCLFNARDLLAAPAPPLAWAAREALTSIGVGAKLMVANLSGLLVLGVARFAIDGVWGVESFAEASFALSIASLVQVFSSQMGMVLFPALRRAGGEARRRSFDLARTALDLVLPVVYVLYVPLAAVLGWWLPAFAQSMGYLALLLPLVAFNAKTDILGTTMFKVQRDEKRLLALNLATLAASGAGVAFGAFALHSIDAVLLSVTAASVARALFAEGMVSRRLDAKPKRPLLGLPCMTAAFAAATVAQGATAAAFAVMLAAFAFYLLVRRKAVAEVAKTLRRSLRRED